MMVRLFRVLRGLCVILGFDYIKTVEAVWAKVKLRDWKKDSVTAGGHA